MKLRAAFLAAFLLVWATPAFSQACSMCYSTAKATSKDGQRAISKGVVVLLLPPLGFMTLGVWAALRYGKRRDLEQARTTVMDISIPRNHASKSRALGSDADNLAVWHQCNDGNF
jgi:hypothetical protein